MNGINLSGIWGYAAFSGWSWENWLMVYQYLVRTNSSSSRTVLGLVW
jgi:hypothetical protein